MQSIASEDFFGQPTLLADGDIQLTVDGVPIAIVIGLHDGEDAGELEWLIRRARAQAALGRIQERAKSLGIDTLTMDEIDAEIAAARTERRV
jgi:hypothetical protein